jgi:hypothetical protein
MHFSNQHHDKKQRFHATVERKPVDRPAKKHPRHLRGGA